LDKKDPEKAGLFSKVELYITLLNMPRIRKTRCKYSK